MPHHLVGDLDLRRSLLVLSLTPTLNLPRLDSRSPPKQSTLAHSTQIQPRHWPRFSPTSLVTSTFAHLKSDLLTRLDLRMTCLQT
jgi:hypothetical protein